MEGRQADVAIERVEELRDDLVDSLGTDRPVQQVEASCGRLADLRQSKSRKEGGEGGEVSVSTMSRGRTLH